jgi:hypothetical protein
MLAPMTIVAEPSPRMRETPIGGEQTRVVGLISLFHLPFFDLQFEISLAYESLPV